MPENIWAINDSTPTPLAQEFAAAAAPWTIIWWSPWVFAPSASEFPPLPSMLRVVNNTLLRM